MKGRKQANFSAHFPCEISEKIKELRKLKPHLSSNQAVVIDCIMLVHAMEKIKLEESVKCQ